MRRFLLDHAGVGEIAKSSDVASVIHGLATDVATNIADGWEWETEGDSVDVSVEDYTTDRAASAVIVKEPTALYHQANDGIVTRSASAAGLEVHEAAVE